MLPASPSPERIALNRVTFGARDADIQLVQQIGWPAWVENQLNPPAGDDPDLAGYLSTQIIPIQYGAYSAMEVSWPAVDENRPLQYINMSGADLWAKMNTPLMRYNGYEFTRTITELWATAHIRNAHSRYQLREVMTDFWLNHFNVAASKSAQCQIALFVYDRDIVRPNALGNFRQMLEGIASSVSMLLYLDNANSIAAHPNENYARELMELHTMGRGAYFGKNPGGVDVSAQGFTDDDIIQASRALSGWTLKQGQYGADGQRIENTGEFIFRALQHNTSAGRCLGFDLSTVTEPGLAQGRKVLDLVANHPATAEFIATKICRRMFGETPPPAVVARGAAAFTANRDKPDQIKQVLRAILLDGPEISQGPLVKVRRPHERVMALVRATGAVVAATSNLFANLYLGGVNDLLFTWPTPDGRPDTNAFWLNTASDVMTWNMLKLLTYSVLYQTQYLDQTPADVLKSPTRTVEYWVERLVGYSLDQSAMNALADKASALATQWARDEAMYRQTFAEDFVSAITTTAEFVYR